MNPLGFAPAQGVGGPIERQVVQSDALQNVESVAQLLKQAFTDLQLVGIEFQRVKPAFGVAHTELKDVCQVEVAHAHGKGFTA